MSESSRLKAVNLAALRVQVEALLGRGGFGPRLMRALLAVADGCSYLHAAKLEGLDFRGLERAARHHTGPPANFSCSRRRWGAAFPRCWTRCLDRLKAPPVGECQQRFEAGRALENRGGLGAAIASVW